MKTWVTGWVIASTFYTCFDVTMRFSHLYEAHSKAIMTAGILINLFINHFVLGYLRGKKAHKN